MFAFPRPDEHFDNVCQLVSFPDGSSGRKGGFVAMAIDGKKKLQRADVSCVPPDMIRQHSQDDRQLACLVGIAAGRG